jgi:hypothetical protein
MKTLSLLRREWTAFTGTPCGQDELEEKGIRWLALGREVTANGQSVARGGEPGEAGLRHTMAVLKEMYEVFGDAEPSEGDGFYRLVEQALANEGSGAESSAAERAGIPRNYSFDQATYWE